MAECGCGHSHGLVVNSRHRADPTRTATIRKQFVAETNRRFKNLRAEIRRLVVDSDAFSLRNSPTTNRREFDFPRSADKVAGFREWLDRRVREGILEVRQGEARASAASTLWATDYISRSYQRGVSHSAATMRTGGASVGQQWVEGALLREIHADRLGLLYTRVYDELEGITQEMDRQISRELADGLAQGLDPVQIARAINDRVKKVGQTRANMLARTEVVNAHAEATLNGYEEAGLQGVTVRAEFNTADDDRVCDLCESLEGTTYRPDEAHGMIPVHPNCRCVFMPAVQDLRRITL